MKKILNAYTLFIYWTSVAQSILRSPEKTGYYVLSYPKSGSNWLCSMLSSYFDIPALESWNERWPVMTRRIYHLHRILFFRSMDRRTVYLVRDGRDVIVSYYFEMIRSPHASSIRNKFTKYVGRPINEANISEVLPEFIDFLYTYRRASTRYDKHLLNALKRDYVMVKFESLRSDTLHELGRIIYELTGKQADTKKIRESVENNDISRVRTQKNAHFVRKGEAGNWRMHFNKNAGERFWSYYGDVMIKMGYESNAKWVGSLPE
jgi:hypothetical protein